MSHSELSVKEWYAYDTTFTTYSLTVTLGSVEYCVVSPLYDPWGTSTCPDIV